jgi:hypothetical protein
MRDGALQLAFHPRLTIEQYSELALLIQAPSTRAELCEALERFAQHWGIQVVCHDAI